VTLSVRRNPYVVPSYSLTGDLLSHLSCGLQYRYQNRGALPPSKPVQLWFGQFIHGTMEEAFRRWRDNQQPLPWSDGEIQSVADTVLRRLTARGIQFQRFIVLGIGIERAAQAINRFGPILFPLITECEVKLKGIRQLPPDVPRLVRESDYYEVTGVVDVITSAQLAEARDGNTLAAQLQGGADRFEVIVDYKGMRRPGQDDPANQAWYHHAWQVMTYAWLRAQQTGSQPVQSALLLYLNELAPGTEDMDKLYEDVIETSPISTDVSPTGANLENLTRWRANKREWSARIDTWEDQIANWWRTERRDGATFPRMPQMPTPLSPDFLMKRAVRVIPIDLESIQANLGHFDEEVGTIERSVALEVQTGRLINSWRATPREENCTICDFRHFCPAVGNNYRAVPTAP